MKVLLGLLFAGVVGAQTPVVGYREGHPPLASVVVSEERKAERLWWLSVGAMGGAAAADLATSWRRLEANPVMRAGNGEGECGLGCVGVKAGVLGGVIAMERILKGKEKKFLRKAAWFNFAVAGTWSVAAARNVRTR